MKARFTIVAVLACWMFACDSDESLNPDSADIFVKYYGQEGDHEGVDVELDRNGYVLVGNAKPTGDTWRIYIEHTDFFGNITQTPITYSLESGDLRAKDAALTNTGNLIIVSERYEADEITGIHIAEFGGGSTPTQEFIFPDDDPEATSGVYIPESITVLTNGDLVIAGSTDQVDQNKSGAGSDPSDFFTLRFSSDMTLYAEDQWKRIHGQSGYDTGQKIVETLDGLVFFGSSAISGNPLEQVGQNFYTFTTQQNGFISSSFNSYGSVFEDAAADITATYDGGFAVLGNTHIDQPSTGAPLIPYISRVNAGNDQGVSGQVYVSEGQLKTEITARAIVESNRGGYIISGNWAGASDQNIYVAMIREVSFEDRPSELIIKWQNTYGFADGNDSYRLIETPEGAIVILGTITLGKQSKMSLIKINSTGELIP